MGRCLQAVHAFKQNITGGAFESLAAGTGDSLAIPDFGAGTKAVLLEAWGANSANACDFGIRSPNMHDNTRGLRMAYDFAPTIAGTQDRPQVLTPPYVRQPLYRTDTLTVEVNGTATNNVQCDQLWYFDDQTGSNQNLYRWEEIQNRVVNTLGVKVSVTAGASGDYGTAVAINASDDRFIADTEYAILGITAQLASTLVTIKGPDTSNRRIGCPVALQSIDTAGWFVDQAVKYQLPTIVAFNSNNKGATFVEAAAVAGGVVTALTVILAELSAA
jgi:hypothetical protein